MEDNLKNKKIKSNNHANDSVKDISSTKRHRSDESPSSDKITKSRKQEFSDMNPSCISSQEAVALDIASSQQSQSNKYNKYNQSHTAPFKIYIQPISNISNNTESEKSTQKKDEKPSKESDRNISAVKIGKLIASEIKSGINEIKAINKNKICVYTNNRTLANKILDLHSLKENDLKAFIPNHLVTRQGILKNVPTDLSEQDIQDNITIPSPFGLHNVISVRRFHKKTFSKDGAAEFVPTKTVLITVEGQTLPNEAFLYYVRFKIELYLPQVKQCYNCFNFGHLKKFCKAKAKCISCGSIQHEDPKDCIYFQKDHRCFLCKESNHLPTSKECEKRKYEQNVRDTATRNNIDIAEARKLHSYSNVSNRIELSRSSKSNDNRSTMIYNSTDNQQQLSYSQVTRDVTNTISSPKYENTNIPATSPRANNRRNKTSPTTAKPRKKLDFSVKQQELMQNHKKLLNSPDGRINPSPNKTEYLSNNVIPLINRLLEIVSVDDMISGLNLVLQPKETLIEVNNKEVTEKNSFSENFSEPEEGIELLSNEQNNNNQLYYVYIPQEPTSDSNAMSIG